MTLKARLRFLGPIACVLMLAAWRSAPPPPPPPPPPQPAAFSMAPGLIEDAAAYADYMAKAAAISPNFTSGEDVSNAVKFGDAYDVGGFQRGEIAYGAIVAMQDPNFVANIRSYGADPQARATLAADIFANPRFVIGLHGADNAAGLVIAALMGQGQKLMTTGAAVKQAAYDVQHQAWSSQVVPDRQGRLAAAKGATGLGAPIPPDEVVKMTQVAEGFSPLDLNAPAASQPYPPLVIDSLALAALAVLGEAGEDHMDQLASILAEPQGQTCLKRVKSSLYECLAVSKPYYEDVFCLGQHILADTGQCVTIDAGAPAPVGTIITLPASTAKAPAAAKATHKKKARRS